MMISVSTLTLEGTLSKLSGLLLILLNGSLVNSSQVVDQMTCRRRLSCQHRELYGEKGQYYVYTICFTFDNTKQTDSKHPIEMEKILTTIDVADCHEVNALFIAERYKKRRISMARVVYSCQTKLSTSQTNPTYGGEGHLLLLLSRHLSLSYLLLLYAAMRRFFC